MLERTLFYSAELAGEGTAQVQSLNSYVEHLALAHNLRPRVLLKVLFDKYPSDLVTKSTVDALMSLRLHIGSPLAGELLSRLELATGRTLAGSTLGAYAQIFAPTELSRHTNAPTYCPRCLAEDEGIPYMRLLWDVACVRACPIHRTRLVALRPYEACGIAASKRLPLAQRPSVRGVCPSCGSLGYKCSSQPVEPADEHELWVAEQVSALLALDSDARRDFSPAHLASGLRLLVDNVYGGSVVRAATDAGLSRGSVSTWVRGARPGLPWILQLCMRSGADLVALLGGKFEAVTTQVENVYKVSPRKYLRAQTPDEAVRLLLDKASVEVPPPSLREFGRRHGVNPDSLRRKFPQETETLCAARTSYLEDDRSQRLGQAIDLFQAAAESLKKRGRAIHRKSLQRESGLVAMQRENRTMYKALLSVLETANG